MRRTGLRSLILAHLLGPGVALAQTPMATTRIEKPKVAVEIKLPGGQMRDREIWNKWNGETIVRNVTIPTLTLFLPNAGKATGAAVVVIPGGGFHFQSMTNEGWPIARQLADRGIAAFVLESDDFRLIRSS